MALCAFFAALSAAFSQFSIPIGPVPIALTHLSVFTAAGLLGAKRGFVSQLIYVLVGLVGAPVFAGASGGPAIVFGPTGGFILSYPVCALVAGLLAEKLGRGTRALRALPFAMAAGLFVTYAMGLAWFMFVTKNGLLASLGYCTLPFLPGDAAKIALSTALSNRLYPVLRRLRAPS